MIKNVRNLNDKLKWEDKTGNSHEVLLLDYSYIYNDNYILVINETKSKAVVLDENEKICGKITNNDKTFLMYLVDHYEYGLCIYASVKDNDGNWHDTYLSFNGIQFNPVIIG